MTLDLESGQGDSNAMCDRKKLCPPVVLWHLGDNVYYEIAKPIKINLMMNVDLRDSAQFGDLMNEVAQIFLLAHYTTLPFWHLGHIL